MYLIRKRPAYILILSFLFLLLSLCNYAYPHVENDEVVYRTLIEKISCRGKFCILPDLKKYTLQDTPALEILDRSVYDKPLFFRPPAYAFTAAIFYGIFGDAVFYFVPPFLYTVMAVLIYECAYIITGSEKTALKAMIMSIFNPFLLFHAFRIWTDLFMTVFIFLSFLYAVKFRYEKKLPLYAFLSGLALTVAVLTKYQAILVMPLDLFLILGSLKKENTAPVVLGFFMPFLLLGYWAWYIIPFGPTLQFLFSNNPTAEEISKFPFVRYVASRPSYYYFLSLFTVNPVNLVLFVPVIRALRSGFRILNITPIVRNIVVPILIFCFAVLIIFSVIGASGSTFQSRYVLMTQPFLVILVSLVPLRSVILRAAAVTAVFFTVFVASVNIIGYNAELFSLPEMLTGKN